MTARQAKAKLTAATRRGRRDPRLQLLHRHGARAGGVHEQQLSLDRRSVPVPLNLGFHTRGGPMLAVVGLCGGAGTTTLAYLTATAAALESTAPVLLADLGGPSGALATYAHAACRESFTTVADHLARGHRPSRTPFAIGEFGVRLLARGPEIDAPVDEQTAAELLGQARAAHGLTVLDCGQLTRPVERIAVARATHVAWVLPATTAGLRRGCALLELLQKTVSGREIIAARHDRGDRAPLSELAQLADRRDAPLVLVPHLDDLAEADTKVVLEQAALPLQALGGVLRR